MRRLLDVKYIATQNESIRQFFQTPLFQLLEKVIVFIHSVIVLIEYLPQM